MEELQNAKIHLAVAKRTSLETILRSGNQGARNPET